MCYAERCIEEFTACAEDQGCNSILPAIGVCVIRYNGRLFVQMGSLLGIKMIRRKLSGNSPCFVEFESTVIDGSISISRPEKSDTNTEIQYDRKHAPAV